MLHIRLADIMKTSEARADWGVAFAEASNKSQLVQ
jgi:hypothetical protein